MVETQDVIIDQLHQENNKLLDGFSNMNSPGIQCLDPNNKVPHPSPSAGFKHFTDVASRQAKSIFSWRFLRARFPVLVWICSYRLENLVGDTIAGVTTALTVIPQGIGYAPLAGLPLQYGLYASVVPGFLYCLVGTTKQITIGPTAVNSIMSYNYAGGTPRNSATLAFFSGLIEMIAGFLNLGFLIRYISGPVISAFTSAVSIQVITSQAKGLLGLKFAGRGFVKTWYGVFSHLEDIRLWDTIVGLVSMLFLLILRKQKEFQCGEGSDPAGGQAVVVKKTKWLFSISGNCLVVILSTLTAFILHQNGLNLLVLTGEVDSGIPPWQLPWNIPGTETSNSTTESIEMEDGDPWEIVSELRLGLLLLPLVSILQHNAIAKHYAASHTKVDASQEIISLGLCNFVGSFVGSMPITASYGRSAVNHNSGVHSPLGGVITGIIIIVACSILTPYFAFIPTSALSAVIIFAMFFTIEYEIVLPLWRSKKIDLVPYSLTFLLGLFVNVETGMIVGTMTHLVMLVYLSTKPNIHINQGDAFTTLRPDRSLYYPSLDEIKTKMNEVESGKVVLDMSRVDDMDYTAAKAVIAMDKDIKKKEKLLVVLAANDNVKSILRGIDQKDIVMVDKLEDL